MQKKKKSVLGGWAIFLSIIPVIHIIGGAFALIDLLFRRKKVRINRAIIALVLSLCWTGFIGYKVYPLVETYVAEVIHGSSRLVANGINGLIETNESFGVSERNVIYTAIRPLKKIEVRSNFETDPIKIKYKITIEDNYEVTSGELEYKESWSIENKGLIVGMNAITVTYIYEDESMNQEFMHLIFNMREENEESLDFKLKDSDSDGLIDYYEIVETYTDPYLFDSDCNGISDADEDLDYDKLSNLTELGLGSKPHRMDTDNDGIHDNEELTIGTNLLESDTDRDGLSDGDEITLGANPLDKKDPGKNEFVTYSEQSEFHNGMIITVNVTSTPENVLSFYMYEIPESFGLSKDNVDGMIGNAILFSTQNAIEKADICIELNCDDYVDGENYYLYYLNEETNDFEYVDTQYQEGNTIYATLEHFSRYIVSSTDPEEEIKGLYASYGIDLKTTEDNNALFESYEEYVKTIYPNDAVLSFNVCSGDIDNVIAMTALRTGHSWISYYYSGDNPRLDIQTVDNDIEDDIAFGAIGFGGWLNGPNDLLGQSFETWNGSMKLPNGYREIYHNGRINNDGLLIYQSDTIPYTKETGMSAENMNAAFISMPFIISEDQLVLVSEFINTYKKQYNVSHNNCTTFVEELFKYAKIDTNIDTRFNNGEWWHLSNHYVNDAGSPGQTAYSIQKEYPDTHVYVVEEVINENDSKLWFTSKMVQKSVSKQECEEIEDLNIVEDTSDITNIQYDTIESIDSTDESDFIVSYSPLGTLVGMKVVIIQGCDEIIEKEQIQEIENLIESTINERINSLNNEYIPSPNIDVLYYQVPSIFVSKIKEQYIPEQYQFESLDELKTKTNLSNFDFSQNTESFIKDFTWIALMQYFSVKTSTNEFFR